ncbi:hypothetical protein JW865_00655, partial [Candidatus Bathyarchaeota archaeon]|nr:hypothetical protein [Candidatus Bathyarchaeota archaeon]
MHRLLSLFFSALLLSSNGLPNKINELHYKFEIIAIILDSVNGSRIFQTNLNPMTGDLELIFLEPIGNLIKFRASINITYHSKPAYNRTSVLLYNPVTNEVSYLNNSIIGVTLFLKNPERLLEDGLISNVPGFEYVCETVHKYNCDTVAGRQLCTTTKSFNVQNQIGSICVYNEYDEDTGILVYSYGFVADPILYSLGIMFLDTKYKILVNEVDLGPTIFEWDLLFMKLGVISGVVL